MVKIGHYITWTCMCNWIILKMLNHIYHKLCTCTCTSMTPHPPLPTSLLKTSHMKWFGIKTGWIEVREWIPVPHDKNLDLLLIHTHAAKVIFTCCSHVNNLKLHDVNYSNWPMSCRPYMTQNKNRFQLIIFHWKSPLMGDSFSPSILSCLAYNICEIWHFCESWCTNTLYMQV